MPNILPFCRRVDLNGYNFDKFNIWKDEKISELSSCQWLDVKHSNLPDVPKGVEGLNSLVHLSLAYNSISRINEALDDLVNLRILDLKSNKFKATNFPQSLNQNITHLDLTNNPLGETPTCIEVLKNLVYLGLSNCELSVLPASIIMHLNQLTHLDLSNNDLDTFPPQIRRLSSLEHLDISNNPKLSAVNLRQISSLTALTTLKLRNTGRTVDNVPTDLFKIRELCDVDLTDNELPRIPEVLFTLTSLKRLNLSENYITELPDAIEAWELLETLSLSQNRLNTLPSSISKLINLRHLYLNCNKLVFSSLPTSLSKLQRLEIFSAAYNNLEAIPEGLCRCTQLRKLILSYNSLFTVPETYHFLKHLEVLATEGNENLVLPPKPKVNSEDNSYFYNIDFSLEAQRERLGEKYKKAMKKGGSLSRRNTFQRRARIQRKKEDEANDKETTQLLKAMKDVSRLKEVERETTTNQIANELTELKQPNRWDENLHRPDVDYEVFFGPNTGNDDGIEIWYMNQFVPASLPEFDYGEFWQSDCYIILHSYYSSNATTGEDLKHDIYFWIGADAALDKKACAAMHAVNLRNHLRASCRCKRQEQDAEDQEFVSLFEDNDLKFDIKVGEYGESGFLAVEKTQYPHLLYAIITVKNRSIMQLMPLDVNSLDPRFVYILDCGMVIFIWHGQESSLTQKSKVRLLAGKISRFERGGTAKSITIQQGNEPPQFWAMFYIRDPSTVSPRYEKNLIEFPRGILFNTVIGFSSEGKSYVELPQVPLPNNMLEKSVLRTGVYILDTHSAIYIWCHQAAKKIVKKAGDTLSAALAELVGRQLEDIQIFHEQDGVESVAFKSHFIGWDAPLDMDFTKRPRDDVISPQEEEASKEMKNNLASLFNPRPNLMHFADLETEKMYYYDDVHQMQAYYFNGKTFEILPKDEYGVFYTGDCYVYVVIYHHPPDLEDDEEVDDEEEEVEDIVEIVIYFWQGRDATKMGKLKYEFEFKKKLENSIADAEFKYIRQQVEDISFLMLFQGEFVIKRGQRAIVNSEPAQPTLFGVRASAGTLFTRCVEVNCDARELNSEFCYLLVVPFNESHDQGVVYFWFGSKSSEYLQQTTEKIAMKLYAHKNFTLQHTEEGNEPEQFFIQAIGGMKPYPKNAEFVRSSNLFRCCTDPGYFLVLQKFIDFSQNDLIDGDVMILDSGTVIWIWLSPLASQMKVKLAYKSAQLYRSIQLSRNTEYSRKILPCAKGHEPRLFTNCFHGWSDW